MPVDHTRFAREAEKYVVRIIDELTAHLTSSNDNIMELRRRLEIETSAALRKAWNDGYSAGCANAIDERPSNDAIIIDKPFDRGSKGSIVPPPGTARLG